MKKKTTKEFKKELAKIQPTLTVKGAYVGAHDKILIEDTLAIKYLVKPQHLLKGSIPSIRTAVDKNLAFKIKANKVHNNVYDYTKSVYVINEILTTITCYKHGDFLQMPFNHVRGQGCPTCGAEKAGWSYSAWKEVGEASPFFDSFKLYMIEIWNEEEKFYKVGKTFVSMGRRFRGGNTTTLPYNYKVLEIIEGSAFYISKLEKKLHNRYKHDRYIPQITFGGMTECFNEKPTDIEGL